MRGCEGQRKPPEKALPLVQNSGWQPVPAPGPWFFPGNSKNEGVGDLLRSMVSRKTYILWKEEKASSSTDTVPGTTATGLTHQGWQLAPRENSGGTAGNTPDQPSFLARNELALALQQAIS